MEQDPYSDIGKPEVLKYMLSGCWSGRIYREHRLIYQIIEEEKINNTFSERPLRAITSPSHPLQTIGSPYISFKLKRISRENSSCCFCTIFAAWIWKIPVVIKQSNTNSILIKETNFSISLAYRKGVKTLKHILKALKVPFKTK